MLQSYRIFLKINVIIIYWLEILIYSVAIRWICSYAMKLSYQPTIFECISHQSLPKSMLTLIEFTLQLLVTCTDGPKKSSVTSSTPMGESLFNRLSFNGSRRNSTISSITSIDRIGLAEFDSSVSLVNFSDNNINIREHSGLYLGSFSWTVLHPMPIFHVLCQPFYAAKKLLKSWA